MRLHITARRRSSLAVLGVALALTAVACGGSSGGDAKVASLGTTPTDGTTATSSPKDTQQALLSFAACMRENGVDMADPTFDASGNPTGGIGLGPNSGIDMRTDAARTAMNACRDLLQGVTLGGGRQGGGLDVNAIQQSLNQFTACLRDQGLDVDDITFGGPGGNGPGGPGGPGGSVPAPDGSVPPGGFGGPPPDGGNGADDFDPTARIIERLGLDDTDPAVKAAVSACQSILDGAFRPTTTEAGA